jgi:hypothetical protein
MQRSRSPAPPALRWSAFPAWLGAALLGAGLPAAQGLTTLTNVPGRVVDLCTEQGAGTSFLYCTSEGEIGRLSTGGVRTVLATAASGPFPHALRALAEQPNGALAVLDVEGSIRSVPSAGGGAALVYSDLYMIQDATDLVVDAHGTFLIASRTPSTGVRALNYVSSDGARWAYYRVAEQPLALCADPLGPGVIYSDAGGVGALRRIDTQSAAHESALLEPLANPGWSAPGLDGDIAASSNGDLWYVAGASLRHHASASGTSSVVATAAAALRGVCVAASSGLVASATGWSAYVAEGEAPSLIREYPGVSAPANAQAPALGSVPDRGQQLLFFAGLNVYELATDANGALLVGGDLWGANAQVRRIQLPSLASTTLASSAQGLYDRVEGLALDAAGRIHVQASSGVLQRLDEAPFALTTLYGDPLNQLQTVKDLLLTRAGTALIAERSGFGSGAIYALPAGAGAITPLVATNESRGIAADPFGARALVAQWNGTAFVGTVDALELAPVALTPLAGFGGINYSNAASWADGDVVADAYGDLYTCSEDDWSVVRYERASGRQVRIGSGYLNHPAGLAIAASSGQTPSNSGWSLYVAEWNFLWEIGNVPAPAPRLVDPAAVPAGRCAGFAPPGDGVLRALCAAADGTALYVSTSAGRVLRFDPLTRLHSEVAGPASGLSGDLVSICARPNGALVVAARDGRVYELAAAPSYAVALLHDDTANLLGEVRGACVDAQGRIVLVERPPGAHAARVLRVEAGVPQLLVHSARGLRPVLDPLNGELWVSEQGASSAGPYADAGEFLRIDAAAVPARAGHHGEFQYATTAHGDLDGGFAFDATGDVYVAEGQSGRVWRVRRDGGARTLIGGNYDAPRGVALAAGTPGIAGPLGTSAYVLDGFALYEHGIAGSAAPLVPQGSTADLEFSLQGVCAPGAALPFAIAHPSDAGRVYVILPTLAGKLPGLPLAALGDPGDPRLLPFNFDVLAQSIGKPALLPGTIGVLDGLGRADPSAALLLPPSPALLGLDAWLDCVWIALDPNAQNGVATVGATAQLYLGS